MVPSNTRAIDSGFFAARIAQALALRRRLYDEPAPPVPVVTAPWTPLLDEESWADTP